MAQTTQGISEAAPCMRSMRMAGKRSGPHQASDAGRCLLRRQQFAATVHLMPQPQECQGTAWYDDASWTWGDYYDELSYITYE